MAAKKINLLPTEPIESLFVTKSVRVAKKVIYVIIFVSLITVSGGIGLLYFYSKSLEDLANKNQNLRVDIKNLETTEQGLITLKDRLTKIEGIMTERTMYHNFQKQKKILDQKPSEITLSESEINSSGSRLDLEAPSSQTLATLIDSIKKDDTLLNLILNKILYTANNGYQISLEVN